MLPEILPLPGSLLTDLLEDSAGLYHRDVAIIQRVFAEQYFQTLAARRAGNRWFAEENLHGYRQALKSKQDELVLAQRCLRQQRDANIHAFVTARAASHASAA